MSEGQRERERKNPRRGREREREREREAGLTLSGAHVLPQNGALVLPNVGHELTQRAA